MEGVEERVVYLLKTIQFRSTKTWNSAHARERLTAMQLTDASRVIQIQIRLAASFISRMVSTDSLYFHDTLCTIPRRSVKRCAVNRFFR